ncbi:hypothetical protein ACN9MU_06040 [Pseudoduganella sp. R-32]|uniref:hypothetical protein n=1 Tax=Pseudoduganella sp. R-32 TaxID=3404061 RepID=UPI003CF6B960
MLASFRREVAGVGHWACGLLCMVGAGGLFLSRGMLPDEAVLPAANTFLMWGIGLSMGGDAALFWRAAGMDDIPRGVAAMLISGQAADPVAIAGMLTAGISKLHNQHRYCQPANFG